LFQTLLHQCLVGEGNSTCSMDLNIVRKQGEPPALQGGQGTSRSRGDPSIGGALLRRHCPVGQSWCW